MTDSYRNERAIQTATENATKSSTRTAEEAEQALQVNRAENAARQAVLARSQDAAETSKVRSVTASETAPRCKNIVGWVWDTHRDRAEPVLAGSSAVDHDSCYSLPCNIQQCMELTERSECASVEDILKFQQTCTSGQQKRSRRPTTVPAVPRPGARRYISCNDGSLASCASGSRGCYNSSPLYCTDKPVHRHSAEPEPAFPSKPFPHFDTSSPKPTAHGSGAQVGCVPVDLDGKISDKCSAYKTEQACVSTTCAWVTAQPDSALVASETKNARLQAILIPVVISTVTAIAVVVVHFCLKRRARVAVTKRAP